jgi:hypothetical protein
MMNEPTAYVVEHQVLGRSLCFSRGLAEERAAERPHGSTITPLYQSGTLLDEEWAAIVFCTELCEKQGIGTVPETLRGLLSRMGQAYES